MDRCSGMQWSASLWERFSSKKPLPVMRSALEPHVEKWSTQFAGGRRLGRVTEEDLEGSCPLHSKGPARSLALRQIKKQKQAEAARIVSIQWVYGASPVGGPARGELLRWKTTSAFWLTCISFSVILVWREFCW